MNVTHSLRTRLLWLLLAAISLAALAQATIAYRAALRDADQIFDYHMQQMALALRSGTPLMNAENGEAAAQAEADESELVFQVWTPDGVQIYRTKAAAGLPQRAVLGFSNVMANGTTYRIFSVQANAQTIQVAQDMAVRRNMATSLALRTVWPVALMAPLLMLVVWLVVSGSLRPVARVRDQLAARRADELAPVSEAGLPDEVKPLVQELNLLFGRVRAAFDAQQHFVADAAHELRTPLAALKLQVQSLERADSDSARSVAVERLLGGIDRATRLVEQLLVLARQEASPPQREPVNLAELGRRVVAELAPSAQARQIDLGLARADGGSVDGQADALHILLRNLVDNAIKYTPAGGTVDVSVEGSDLVVEDSGPGIGEAERARVFDRFYRIAGSAAGGSGLGLAIVQAIAERHGARVELGQSVRLGGLRAVIRFGA